MLQRKQVINLQLNQVLDAITLVVLLYLTHAVRFVAGRRMDVAEIGPFEDFRWMVFILVPLAPLLLELQGYYRVSLSKPAWQTFGDILRAGIWIFIVIGACVIFFRLEVPSRSVLLIFAALGMAFLFAKERFLTARLRHRAKMDDIRERVIVVGTVEDAKNLESSFDADTLAEMAVVDRIDIESQPIADLIAALHRHSVGRVIFAGRQSHVGRLQEGIAACEDEGVEAYLALDFLRTSIAKPDFTVLSGKPMLVFRSTPDFSWEMMAKDAIDRVGALVGLMLLSPLLLIAAIGIKASSEGPVIFSQMRSGRHGRPFRMLKFRTMITDAEMRRAELVAFNQMSGPVFKIDNDPRITRFGKWLRKTSIDEFPQLINVLRGEMSLVGPRPLPVYEVEKFEDTRQRRRLSMKPGLTCLWQISGRNEIKKFEDWVLLDLKYIDSWSLWLDIKILLKTVPVMLTGFGAR